MATTYDYSKAPVVLGRLTREITVAGLPEPEGMTWNSGETPYDLHITFTNPLDAGQQTTLDNTVTAHNGSIGSVIFPQPRLRVEGARLTWVANDQVKIGTVGEVSAVDDYEGRGVIAWTGELPLIMPTDLDTGAEAPSADYAVYAIADSTRFNPVKGLYSTANPTPAAIPQGYDLYRRIGWISNKADSNFRKVIQTLEGNVRCYWYDEDEGTLRVLDGGSATSYTEVDFSALVPPGARDVHCLLALKTGLAGSAGDDLRLRPLGFTADPPAWRTQLAEISDTNDRRYYLLPLDAAQKAEYKVTRADNSAKISVMGFYDRV